jgi:FPC/CPF motif-containing protein YcgG
MRLFDYELNPLSSLSESKSGVHSAVPAWVKAAHSGFYSTIKNNLIKFPCVFAPYAYDHQDLYFTYLEAEESNSPGGVIQYLENFLRVTSKSERYPVLIVFVETEKKSDTLTYFEETFWKIVNVIANYQSPKYGHSTETKDSAWRLYFKDTPLFINGHSRAYKRRISRRAPCDLMLVVQEYRNLHRLQKKHSDVSRLIRENMEEYDGMPISRVFGENFADMSCLDWQQFWLAEDDTLIDHNKQCPIKYL